MVNKNNQHTEKRKNSKIYETEWWKLTCVRRYHMQSLEQKLEDSPSRQPFEQSLEQSSVLQQQIINHKLWTVIHTWKNL